MVSSSLPFECLHWEKIPKILHWAEFCDRCNGQLDSIRICPLKRSQTGPNGSTATIAVQSEPAASLASKFRLSRITERIHKNTYQCIIRQYEQRELQQDKKNLWPSRNHFIRNQKNLKWISEWMCWIKSVSKRCAYWISLNIFRLKYPRIKIKLAVTPNVSITTWSILKETQRLWKGSCKDSMQFKRVFKIIRIQSFWTKIFPASIRQKKLDRDYRLTSRSKLFLWINIGNFPLLYFSSHPRKWNWNLLKI